MTKQRLAIFGCGKLAHIVVDALTKGLLPDYTLVGTYSNTYEKAKILANRVTENACKPCSTMEDLLRLKPDYIVEAASPQGMKTLTLPALKNGTSIVSLSIGALADEQFLHEARETAIENKVQIHLVSGAIGGFDILRTASLMGKTTASIHTEKGPHSLKGTSVYEESLQKEQKKIFSGNAKEAIALFPTKVNVAVAASLASVGAEDMKVSITSTPDYVGDDHRIEIQNDQVHAVIDTYSKTSQIAGWSVVHTLQNITSPIVFG